MHQQPADRKVLVRVVVREEGLACDERKPEHVRHILSPNTSGYLKRELPDKGVVKV